MVGNLQTYELGLTRIEKSSKSKSMALKAKSSDTDKSSDDEDSKMKSYITTKFKKFMRMPTRNDLTRIESNPVLCSSKVKTKGRRMLGMVVNTLFLQDQNALGVRVSIT